MAKLDILSNYPMQVFDNRLDRRDNPLGPLIWTDVFLERVNQYPKQSILHIWPMASTVILGLADKNLPEFAAGLQAIYRRGYQPLVRQMGGLAVVADQGILNFSLFLPLSTTQLSIHQAYQLMANLVRQLFLDFPVSIEAFEISQSYCPGQYDLSIAGQKFAGLAQRRVKNGLVCSVYLSVSGNQGLRGEMIREFYHLGQADKQDRHFFPQIDPDSMATLSDLLGFDLTVDDVVKQLYYCLEEELGLSLTPLELKPELEEAFQRQQRHSQQRQKDLERIR
ncbi:lipoate--protein ligase family protein [Streptococcus cuniculipharyngis]|uniref:Protein--protein lipoyl transferase n=1 Tax=Streptococcus cuniculipharyngis TaxID=1562651 RepID=A0A5C5SEU1_9STRE|nr:protein--protein lipoyl transferase [Streptococcus cuniculipharyngis]TWS98820.1 protein--protein lipoyl transferase [Streptococcus cuniculipharyngis]